MTLEAPRETASRKLDLLIGNVEKVILGKRDAITLAVVGLLSEGHLLFEDVPGTGKTTLARALARSVEVDFRRIQFTSDLLPSDVLGLSTPNPRTGDFEFRPGPIFTNILLADELNRTPPRTQSALLECMNEARVTIDGADHELARPFLVIATQNPLEFEGTYPLPESQLDRFLMRIRIGYPERDVEREVLLSQAREHPLDSLESVVDREQLASLTAAVKDVRVDENILEYLLRIVEMTRKGDHFLLGASPRAGLGLFRAAQALALIEDRDFCVPDDVKRLAVPVLAHRLMPSRMHAVNTVDDGGPEGGSEDVLAELLEDIPVPE